MKSGNLKSLALLGVTTVALLSAPKAEAQYYEIVNQLPNLISPALSGSMNYKGYVDVTGTLGVGENRANFFGISTSQGFQYSSWFFMGAGLGIALAVSVSSDGLYYANYYQDYPKTSLTKAMIPVFSDFRFNIGGVRQPSFFIDIKAGAAWLIGDSYLQLAYGALSNKAKFFLRPSIGIRIPTSRNNPKSAMNIGVTYQLLTADNSWNYWYVNNGPALNSLGLTVGYEW